MLIHELDAFRFAADDDVEGETWGDRAAELEHLEGFELGEGGEGRVLEGEIGTRRDASTKPFVFFDQGRSKRRDVAHPVRPSKACVPIPRFENQVDHRSYDLSERNDHRSTDDTLIQNERDSGKLSFSSQFLIDVDLLEGDLAPLAEKFRY